ncbi:MAG: hypothetical protein ACTHJT_15100 [Cytophaga sp.]|uniref:hypothetical protein n=1 Tax=Cytophaga sp. TaxID=29535 RepID=UPI003F7D8541
MIYRHLFLLMFIALTIGITSCNNNKQVKARTSSADFMMTKKIFEDSVLNSIEGQTKTFTINPAKQQSLVSKKGIKLSIPANAFVTASGEKPTSNIKIKVSEYHTTADILISKIPMQYKTASGLVQMESAGMFNIEASAKGKPLQLAQGKEIGLQVPSKNKDTDFNLYYFDPVTNEWKQTMDKLPVVSEERTEEENPAEKISTSGTAALDKSQGMTIEWAATDAVKRMIDGKTVILVKPKCLYDDVFFTFPIITNKYPELAFYKEAVWTGTSSADNNKLQAAFESDQLIYAEILERETPLNKYLMSFEFKHVKFRAYMSIASKSDFCDINDEIYLSLYEQRPANEVKIEKITRKIKKQRKEDEIYRSFAINKLGIWNCDRLYLLEKKVNITPRFRTKSTNELHTPATTFLIDKKINSVWTYQKEVTLNPDSDNILVFVSDKGRLCYARINTLPAATTEKTVHLDINVTEMEDKPDSTDELNALLEGV